MKIIDNRPFNFEFQCRGCKSKLAAEADDVKAGYFGANYGGDTPTREYYVECIVCGTIRTLEYHEVTPNIQKQVDKKYPRRNR